MLEESCTVERFYAVTACTGQMLHIPESRMEAFKKRNEELKQAMAEGWKPGTPLPDKYRSHRRQSKQ